MRRSSRAASDGARAELALATAQLLGAHLLPGWRCSNSPGGGGGDVHCASLAGLGPEAPLLAAPWHAHATHPLSWRLPGGSPLQQQSRRLVGLA